MSRTRQYPKQASYICKYCKTVGITLYYFCNCTVLTSDQTVCSVAMCSPAICKCCNRTLLLPSTVAFRLEYVLFYQVYAKITTFFDHEMFGTALLLYIDVEMFGGNWRQDVKNDVETSKTSYWRHARESSYTPHVRRHFLAPVEFTAIPVGYARKCRLTWVCNTLSCMTSIWRFWRVDVIVTSWRPFLVRFRQTFDVIV